ncbi:MAG TPA: DinB family protein [Hanamia sp.]
MTTEISIEFEKTSDELIRLISSISEEQFNEIPFDGSWTAAQVGDHLLKSYGLIKVLNGQAVETRRLPVKEIETVKKIFIDFDAKYKSAENLFPTNEPIEKEKLLSELHKRIGQIKEVIQIKDLTETCVGVPFKGIGELTRIEWLYVILYHTQRHIHQIKNILKSLESIVNKES